MGDCGKLRGVCRRTAAARSLTCGPQGTAADVFVNWLSALHMGEVFGFPYKVVLCLLGLVVAGLSATGVLIWWRKLQSRHAMHPKLAPFRCARALQQAHLRRCSASSRASCSRGALTGAFHNIL